nr:hypothetical protein [Nocardia harenae]
MGSSHDQIPLRNSGQRIASQCARVYQGEQIGVAGVPDARSGASALLVVGLLVIGLRNGRAFLLRVLDQRRETCPHDIVGPGEGCIQSGLIDRSWADPGAARLPLRYQAFVHAEMGGELPDTHALGIAKGPGLSS